jgi:hypothetical protein
MQSSQLVVRLFNQDLQMAFRLRSEAIIPLHGRCRRIVQRQVKAPEQVCDCQVELCICETRRERRNQCGKDSTSCSPSPDTFLGSQASALVGRFLRR